MIHRKNRTHFVAGIFLTAGLFLAVPSYADVLASWNFDNTDAPWAASTTNSNLNVSEITTAIGTGTGVYISVLDPYTQIDTTSYNNTSYILKFKSDDRRSGSPATWQNYFSTTLQSTTGTFSIESISFNLYITKNNGIYIYYRTDADGEFALYSGQDSFGETQWKVKTLTSELQNLSYVEFRFYSAIDSKTTSTTIDDFSINGVFIQAIPEPAAISLLATGVAMFFGRKQGKSRT